MSPSNIYTRAINIQSEVTQEEKIAREQQIEVERETREVRRNWLHHPLTQLFVQSLKDSRTNILNDCALGADALTDEQRSIVLAKLKEAQTLNKVIDYATGISTNYSN